MLPGPIYIYKCPNCSNLLTRGSSASGNTFGAKIYSDGKRIAPMLPDFPDLTKCKKCDTIFWLNKLEEIGTYEWGDPENLAWQNADEAEFLKLDDYFTAIDTGIAENKEEELIIRQLIWWTYNDRTRNGSNIFTDEADELSWKENSERLMTMLDQSDINQRIMLAEICRNLGDFVRCINIIQTIDNDDLNWLKKRFVSECKRKNRWVVELN